MPQRPPNILGLRTVIYKVADLSVAKKWFAQAFDTEPYFNEPYYVGYNIGGYELGLQPDDNATHGKTESVVTYWGVNDITTAYTHIISLGAREHEPPHDVGGGIEVASLKDPWNNLIGLIYNPHFMLKS